MLLDTIQDLQDINLIAETWLSEGALSFSYWEDNQLARYWGTPPERTGVNVVSALVTIYGEVLGELCVSGVDYKLAFPRLQADARLLSRLLPLQQERTLLAEELVDSRDQLITLWSLSDIFSTTMNIEELLKHMAEAAVRLSNAQVGIFMLENSSGNTLIVTSPDTDFDVQFLQSLFEKASTANQPFVVRGHQDRWGNQNQFICQVIPMKLQNHQKAILGLVKADGEFTYPDIQLGKVMADYAASRVDILHTVQLNLDRVRMETEMDLAQKIQLSLMPKNIPQLPGLDIWVSVQPTSGIGGDFYDCIYQNNQVINLIMGDISGKGMPAALLLAMTLKVVRQEISATNDPSPAQIIVNSNWQLYKDFSEAIMFSTLFIGQYFPETRRLVYSNAGHYPVIHCPVGGEAELLRADAIPIGLFQDLTCSDNQLRMSPGDIFLLSTDGICETTNQDKRLFGFTRLMHLVEEMSASSAQEIGRGILTAVESYGAGRTQEDDRTLIVIKAI